jgi:hypothetical protein
MEPDDQALDTVPIDGSGLASGWPGAAAAAREAALGRLRALGADPEPGDEAILADRFANGDLRSIDDEPARLVYDSLLDTELHASVRAASPGLRQLTFEARDLSLELEVSSAGQLMGQVVPPQAAIVEVRHRAGTASVDTDDLGFFHLARLPAGPVSLRCQPTARALQAVATSWITL